MSLLPAATDIVAALGAADRLVGRTHECDWPPGLIDDVPVLTGTSVPADASSREISRAIGGAAGAHTGSSLYQVDLDALRDAAPDLVLTQDLCRVCAVSYRSISEAVRIQQLDTMVVSLEARTLDGIFRSMVDLGQLLRIDAEPLVEELKRRLARLPGQRIGERSRPNVLFVEWLDPLMLGGHWVPEQIAWAGGRSVLSGSGRHSEPLEWSVFRTIDPDLVVLGPCGFEPSRTEQEWARARDRDEWRHLAAVRHDRVRIVDGPAYFNRPGPRVVDGAEILADLLSGM